MASKTNDLVWARDNATGEVGQYTESFLGAWPGGYYRLTEEQVKAAKPSTRASDNSKEGAV